MGIAGKIDIFNQDTEKITFLTENTQTVDMLLNHLEL